MIRRLVYIYALLLCTMLSIALGVSGQSDSRRISGLVLERGSNNARISDVNVTNLRTRQQVRTSSMGVFTIEANVGDSLSFSKIGYGPIKTVVNVLEDIIVDMQPGLEIETVVVTRSTRETELQDALSDYRRKGVHNGGHNTVGTYLASPATALYNLFGKEPRNARRFEEYMNQEVDALKVDRIFNRRIVTEITALEGEELQAFMELYRPSLSMAESWGQYDLMLYINNSFKSWEANGRPRPEKLPKLEIPQQER